MEKTKEREKKGGSGKYCVCNVRENWRLRYEPQPRKISDCTIQAVSISYAPTDCDISRGGGGQPCFLKFSCVPYNDERTFIHDTSHNCCSLSFWQSKENTINEQ